MKKTLYLALFLAIISALAGGALTLTNDLTIDKINENKIAAEKSNLELIFPGADFTAIEGYKDDTGLIAGIYQAGDTGYVYKLVVDGYGGKGSVTFMVGFADGKIAGYQVIEHGETKGIGSQVAEEKFINSVVGKNIGDKIDTISGATISSSAVVNGINVAVDNYNANYAK